MTLKNAREFAHTQGKLARIEGQIARARLRATSPENEESIEYLSKMAGQLRSELSDGHGAPRAITTDETGEHH